MLDYYGNFRNLADRPTAVGIKAGRLRAAGFFRCAALDATLPAFNSGFALSLKVFREGRPRCVRLTIQSLGRWGFGQE